MKYYVVAGEASGDLHGANLIKQIKSLDAEAQFRAWGGDLMQEQGAEVVKHYRDLAFMGFLEVAKNIRTILSNLKFCKKDIEAYQPDAVILVDYPGFNLRIAKAAKVMGLKVYYYISPTVWAWKANRAHTVKDTCDKMFCILPFEADFYSNYNGYKADFVGHPLLDALEVSRSISKQEFYSKYNLNQKPIVALLPGSRKQEISTMLPLMKKVSEKYTDYQFVVAGAPSQSLSFYQEFVGDDIPVIENKTYDLLSHAHAALVTSGTATLETALFGVPEVVCYKTSNFSYQIGKRLVKNIEYISLVNLIMDKEIVTELIQEDFNEQRVSLELSKILEGTAREKMKQEYSSLLEKLGGKGASKRCAQMIVHDLKL